MNTKSVTLFAAPLSAILLFFLLRYLDIGYEIAMTAAVTWLTATLWITEAIPIPATSLIPFFAFPLTNILSYKQVAAGLSPVMLLLMGGLMLAKSLEKSGVHRRFALAALNMIGGRGKRIVFAFMLTAALVVHVDQQYRHHTDIAPDCPGGDQTGGARRITGNCR